MNQTNPIASYVLVTIVMLFELGITIYGNKRNYITNFIQKISFMRYALVQTSISLFLFQYNLRFSYFEYGNNPLKSLLPNKYQ